MAAPRSVATIRVQAGRTRVQAGRGTAVRPRPAALAARCACGAELARTLYLPPGPEYALPVGDPGAESLA